MPETAILSDDDIGQLTKDILENIISNESYKHSNVSTWNDSVVEQVIQKLVAHNSQYKYIANCTVIQKNGAGISDATKCYWNNEQDKYRIVRWENKHLHCIVHIFSIPL